MYIKRSRSAAGRNGWRRRQLGRITGLAGLLLVSAVIAASTGLSVAQAQAAAGPNASVAFAAARVSAGTRPVLKFTASDVPAGSVIYVDMAAGAGRSWQFIGRIKADSGSVRLPADPVGRYQYRILVARGDSAIVTSAPASLTVTAKPGRTANTSICEACGVANDVLPWLAPIVAPVIISVGQQIGSALVALLALIFG
jgi:hypothetical protein